MASVAEVDAVAGAPYIDKYLLAQSYHVREYVMGAGRVFPGWVSWSRWFKSNYGVYPDEKYSSILVKLARKSKEVRDRMVLPELMKMKCL